MADPSSVNYDQVSVYSVDPATMKSKLDNMQSEVQNVQDYLQSVMDALSSLDFSWAGESADDANDFNNRWVHTMEQVWGTEEHPEIGVLNAILNGLGTAIDNYGSAESGLRDAFNQMLQDFGGDGDGQPTPSSPPPSITDSTLTAITETWG